MHCANKRRCGRWPRRARPCCDTPSSGDGAVAGRMIHAMLWIGEGAVQEHTQGR